MQQFEHNFPGLGLPSINSVSPLPPESRKGWLIVFASLGVLAFGIWAVELVSSGMNIHSQSERLNRALQMESQYRDVLLDLDALSNHALENHEIGDNQSLWETYRSNYERIRQTFTGSLPKDSVFAAPVAKLDSAVAQMLAEVQNVLKLATERDDRRLAALPKRKIHEVEILATTAMKRVGQHHTAAIENLRGIERQLQSQRGQLLDAQTQHFRGMYVLTGISFCIGLLAVWFLMRIRASQKSERAATESLSQTLTEIKVTEEALRASNERFHLASSAISGVIYDRDVEKDTIIWTENLTAVFGYALEEIRPTSEWWAEHIHPSDQECVRIQLKENLAAGRDFVGEYRFRHKEGHYLDVWDHGRVVRGSSGKVVRMVGSMVDVSEQKRVEKALRAIAEGISSSTGVHFFRSLVRHLASALGVKYAFIGEIVDEDMRQVRSVAVWTGEGYAENFEYDLAGTPCENVVGKELCFYPREVQAKFPADQTLKEMGAESYLGTPLFDFSGKPLGLLAVLHTGPMADEFDLRSILSIFALRASAELERKQTEEALRESEERFRSIFENASAGMITVAPDGRFLQVNPAFCKWLGYTEVELLQMHTQDITHPDDLEITRAALVELASGKKHSIDLEKRYVLKDGQVVWAHISSAWLYDPEGNPLYGVALIQDISEKKRAVEEMARARDVALEQAQLKSSFLANMSHEIRTPMNGVLGYLGLLASRAFADEREMEEFVRGAKGSAESLLTIINDILDFSKIEAGKLTLENIDFDLRSVVEETASLLAPKAEQKGMELACLVEFGVPLALKGDPTRLRQVLVNLTGNAVKFTEKGEVVIRAGLVDENDKSARIRFSVKDTGIGIPPEKHHLLFQSFTQVDGSSTRRFGGTGLGLAISKQLVELMGGHIAFQSEPGKGSEFWFEVTLAKNLSARPRAVSADVRNVAVLVVDDNGVNRDVICRMVESFDCRSFSADGANEAMKILQKQSAIGDPIRVAIIDFQMPEQNGDDLARKVKSDPALAGTRLILLTSVGTRGDAARARAAGFAAYLHKPVKQSQLLEAITAVLGRSGKEEAQPLITRHWLEEIKRGGRILLAEDNQVNQAVAEAVLTRVGYTVVCVKDGCQALEALAAQDFELVLMDVQMPEMDGIEATREIRRMAYPKSKIPVIAMTAHALAGDREKCLAAGMNDYISKPIEPLELKSAVERWMAVPRPPERSALFQAGVQEAPVDWARLNQSSGGDAGFRSQLSAVFISDCESRLRKLQELLAAGDLGRAAREAHSIKGAAANIGAIGLSGLASELERQAGSKAVPGCRDLAAKILAEFERVRGVLTEKQPEKT